MTKSFLPRPFAVLGIAAAVALAMTSCEPIDKLLGKSGDSGARQVVAVSTFAIIDLDEIARRIGRSTELQGALEGRQQQLVQQLVQIQSTLQQRVDARKEALGDKPTPEQEQELANLAVNLNQEFAKARAQAQQAITQEQLAMIQQFRQEVLPIAAEIASQRGLTTILTKNDAVLFAWDPASDITEEVIRRMTTPVVP